jgi:hypothetical protein
VPSFDVEIADIGSKPKYSTKRKKKKRGARVARLPLCIAPIVTELNVGGVGTKKI